MTSSTKLTLGEKKKRYKKSFKHGDYRYTKKAGGWSREMLQTPIPKRTSTTSTLTLSDKKKKYKKTFKHGSYRYTKKAGRWSREMLPASDVTKRAGKSVTAKLQTRELAPARPRPTATVSLRSRRVYIAVIPKNGKWSFEQAVQCAVDNAPVVSQAIRYMLMEDEEFVATPGSDMTRVWHLTGNSFVIEAPRNVPWPTFYFEEDVHNQDVKIKNRSYMIEMESSMTALQSTYRQVYGSSSSSSGTAKFSRRRGADTSTKSKNRPTNQTPDSTKSKNRGCIKQTTKKYITRDGPAYPANECPPGMAALGNDELMYVNVQNKKGINQWRKIKVGGKRTGQWRPSY